MPKTLLKVWKEPIKVSKDFRIVWKRLINISKDFPKVSKDFPKVSKDFPKVSKERPNIRNGVPNIQKSSFFSALDLLHPCTASLRVLQKRGFKISHSVEEASNDAEASHVLLTLTA